MDTLAPCVPLLTMENGTRSDEVRRRLPISLLSLSVALLVSSFARGAPEPTIDVPLEYTRTTDGGIFSSYHVDTLTGRFELEGATYFVSMQGYRSGSGLLTGLFASKESRAREKAVSVDTISLSIEKGPDWPVSGPVPHQLLLARRLFDLKLDTAARTLRLAPVEEPLFPVTLSVVPEQIILIDLAEKQKITAFRPGEALMLPRGSYSLYEYDLLRGGPEDTTWALTARNVREEPSFKVTEEPVIFAFGEPYAPRIAIPAAEQGKARRGAGSIGIEFKAEGKAGEHVVYTASRTAAGVTPWRRSNRPKPPTFKIVKPDGEVVAAGRFEYG